MLKPGREELLLQVLRWVSPVLVPVQVFTPERSSVKGNRPQPEWAVLVPLGADPRALPELAATPGRGARVE